MQKFPQLQYQYSVLVHLISCHISYGYLIVFCSWISDFSLRSWATSKGIVLPGPLTSPQSTELLDLLGMSVYLNPAQCQKTGSYYTPSTNGWKKGRLCDRHWTCLIVNLRMSTTDMCSITIFLKLWFLFKINILLRNYEFEIYLSISM